MLQSCVWRIRQIHVSKVTQMTRVTVSHVRPPLYTVIASPVTRTQSQLETQVSQTLGKTSHLPRKLCLSHRSLTCCKCKECSFPWNAWSSPPQRGWTKDHPCWRDKTSRIWESLSKTKYGSEKTGNETRKRNCPGNICFKILLLFDIKISKYLHYKIWYFLNDWKFKIF